MQIPHNGHVLVADGAKMLFFRNEGDGLAPNLQLIDGDQQADDYDRDIKTDLAGQKPGGSSTAGEADFHQQAEDRFAADAAAMLNRRAEAGEFDTLVIVAAPRTLGELRKHYGKKVQDRLLGEIGKDLTGHSVDRIEQALAAA